MIGGRRRLLGNPFRAAAIAVLLGSAWLAPAASAQERFGLIVSGAPGGEPFEKSYAEWQRDLRESLIDRFGFDRVNVTVLSGVDAPETKPSTQEHVRAAVEELKGRVRPDDLVLLVLIGHGTVGEAEAKFNLVGPDLTSAEWNALLDGMPGRLVVINTTGGSFPFLRDLASKGRIVVTATQSVAQRFDTVYPEQLVAALKDPSVDLDKNGRVSIWELFVWTSRNVATHYERQGLLPTERAMLDDDGDGRGVEAEAPDGEGRSAGADGALARATFLERDPAASTTDPETAALLARRRELEEEAERLKARKPEMPIEVWEREFEALMIELARVSQKFRARS